MFKAEESGSAGAFMNQKLGLLAELELATSYGQELHPTTPGDDIWPVATATDKIITAFKIKKYATYEFLTKKHAIEVLSMIEQSYIQSAIM